MLEHLPDTPTKGGDAVAASTKGEGVATWVPERVVHESDKVPQTGERPVAAPPSRICAGDLRLLSLVDGSEQQTSSIKQQASSNKQHQLSNIF